MLAAGPKIFAVPAKFLAVQAKMLADKKTYIVLKSKKKYAKFCVPLKIGKKY